MKQAIQRLIICLIFLSGGLSAQTTYTWTGGNGSWSVPAKWIPAGVPGSQDTARIFNGTVTVNINVGVAKVLLAATGLNGDSTLTVTDSLIWRAGSPSGSGSIDIASGAVLLIEGDLNRTLSRTINNAGSAVWRGNNDIQFVLGGTFNNLPGGVFEAHNDRRLHTDGGNGAGYFNNQGIFRKAAGSGTSEIGGGQGVRLNNDGLVEVLSGTLGLGDNLSPANSGGTFNVAAGTILRFIRGTHNLLAGSQVSGEGEVRFNGGTVNVAGQYDVALTRVSGGTANFNNTTPGAAVSDTLRLSSGNLGGSGQFDVNGPAFWSGGTLGTRFTTAGIINLNGGGVIGGTGEKQYGGGSNSFGGLMVWKDSGNINVNTGGNLTIQAGATFEIINDQQLFRSNGGIHITNYGTIRKTASFGYTYIGRVFGSFNNHGLVAVESGYLNINGDGGGNDDGAYVVSPFATLWFSGGTQNLSGSATISGGGDLLVSGGTVNHGGGYTLTGRTRVSGGTLNFNNTSAGAAVAQNVFLSGGNLGGTGRLDIDGNFDWSGGTLGTRFSNVGIINLNAGGQIRGNNDKQHGGGTTNNYGVLVWSDSGDVNINTGGTFNNQAGALFDIRNDQSFFRTNGFLNFNNDGLIRKAAGNGTSRFDATFATFNNNGVIDVQTGTLQLVGFGGIVHNNGEAVIDANAQLRLSANQNFLNDGSEIRGDGLLVLETSSTHINNGGFGPGIMAGVLTVSGPFSPGAQADVNIEIGGHTPGTAYDRLLIPGSATLNGALNVSFINSFQPAIGDTFTVLSAGTLNGQFAQVNAPPGVTVQASYPGDNRVVVTVTDVTNTPPLAGDESLVTNEDQSGAVNVLLNDSDPQGDPLSITQIFQPQNGMVIQQGDSVLVYAPYPNYFGPDTFYYYVSDGLSGSDEGMVTVTVDPVNDPPVQLGIIPDQNVTEDFPPLSFNPRPLFSDIDSPDLTYSAGDDGLVTAQVLGDTLLQVLPVFNAFGTSTVTLSASDGEFTVTDTFRVNISPEPDPPTPFSLLAPANDSRLAQLSPVDFRWQASIDPDGDPLSYTFDLWEAGGGPLDTTIAGLSDSTLLFDGSQVLNLESEYFWSVRAQGGPDSVQADTFRFYTPFPLFTPITAPLAQVSSGGSAWGDYDNDGDLDLALCGWDVNQVRYSRIYRNDNGSFVDINAALSQLSNGSLAWGDYDNDGDLDLALTGFPDGGSSYVSQIYRNDNGSFVNIQANLLGSGNGSAAWGDYDNDGDLDLLLTGAQIPVNTPMSRIYRNDGGSFSDAGAGLRNVQLGQGAWGDYDNDGDLDIILAGVSDDSSAIETILRLYRNDGGRFREMPTNMPGVSRCALAWGDYDNDGDLDLFLSGNDASFTAQARLYRNEGGAAFSEVAASFPAYFNSTAAWGDYDNDGDLDLVYSGRTGFPLVRRAHLFRNDGGSFNDTFAPLPEVSTGPLVWGDFDNDADLDLLVSGLDTANTYYTGIYRNNVLLPNTPPNQPIISGVVALTDTSARLRWLPAGDGQTPAPGLSYNLRIGTTPGGAEVMSAMSAADGTRRIAQMGVASDTTWRLRRLQPDTRYYWSVQALDHNFAGSAFAVEDSFITPLPAFTPMAAPLAQVSAGGSAWGDYDNDGDLDLALSGWDTSQVRYSRIYRNDTGSLVDINAALSQLSSGSLAWGDYDNDGDLDLALTGFPDGGSGYVSQIYRNDNGSFANIQANLLGSGNGSAAWGDYDNDGDLDLLLTGAQVPVNTPMTRLYRNDRASDGRRIFTDARAGLRNVQLGQGVWGDYDNDGDLDIILAGVSDDSSAIEIILRLYRNNSGLFSEVPVSLPGVSRCALAWGDYDNDGDLDLFLSGLDGNFDAQVRLYRNDGGENFSEVSQPFPAYYNSTAAWGDYDNDGDLDLAYSGRTGFPLIRRAHLFRNDGGNFSDTFAPLPEVSTGPLIWGDYDNDADLDLLVSGLDTANTYYTRLYRNNVLIPNSPPTAPAGLSALAQTLGTTLRWGAASDSLTPAAALSYNLRIGTTPGGEQVLSPMAGADGARRIAQPGAVNDTLRVIRRLLPGKYYWSVQAIDHGLAGSAFAAEDSFTVNQTRIIYTRTRLRKTVVSGVTTSDTLRIPLRFPLENSPYLLRDVNITIDTLLYSDVSNLEITLQHQGITDTLVFGLGIAGADFLGTVFDDSAAVPIGQGAPPFSGSFRPHRPLAQFNGIDPEGEWRIEIFDHGSGNSGRLDGWSLELTFGLPTGIDNDLADASLPTAYALAQNYPNPFNPLTTIRYALPVAGKVRLEIFNILGQRVAVLEDRRREAGYYSVQWDAGKVASGVYFYRLKAGDYVKTLKMLLVR